MTVGKLLKEPSAFLPFGISAAALCLIIGRVALFGVEPNPSGDEGVAARLFQLMLASQLVVTAYFGIEWLPRAFVSAAAILLLQFTAAAVPVVIIIALE